MRISELGFGTFLVPAVSVFVHSVINGHSVSVFRYFPKEGHSVSVFRYCISVPLKKLIYVKIKNAFNTFNIFYEAIYNLFQAFKYISEPPKHLS